MVHDVNDVPQTSTCRGAPEVRPSVAKTHRQASGGRRRQSAPQTCWHRLPEKRLFVYLTSSESFFEQVLDSLGAPSLGIDSSESYGLRIHATLPPNTSHLSWMVRSGKGVRDVVRQPSNMTNSAKVVAWKSDA